MEPQGRGRERGANGHPAGRQGLRCERLLKEETQAAPLSILSASCARSREGRWGKVGESPGRSHWQEGRAKREPLWSVWGSQHWEASNQELVSKS